MFSKLVYDFQEFEGATCVFGDVTDIESIKKAGPVNAVVSCLASRTGGKV